MVTLEISSTSIRLMEVSDGKVIRWASGSLEAGIIQEEVVSNLQALGLAVKQLMASSGIKEKKVIASVSSLYSLSRLVTVPTPLGQPVTEEAVLEAGEETMPLSTEETYLSWHTIAPGEGGQQVLLVGVPREVIDSEVRALKAVDVNPHILELKTLALARAVNREQALILNIDTSSFDVIMVVRGVAEVLQTTAWQPAALAVEERAEQLTSALNMTIRFYNSRHPDSPLDPATPLFITGDLSGDLSLIELIQGEIEHPIEPLAPPLEYPEHLPISQYAVNIGLALKTTLAPKFNIGFFRKSKEAAGNVAHIGYSIPDMNLLPRIYKPWRPSAKQVSISLAVVALLGLLIPLYQVTTAAMKETAIVKQRLAAVNSMLEQRKLELSKREPLQSAVAQYNSIVAMGGGFVDDLTAIRSLAEELGVTVTAIGHSGGKITFFCEAPDYTIFRDFIRALEENGRFTTPVIPPEGYPYIKGGTITLQPKPGS